MLAGMVILPGIRLPGMPLGQTDRLETTRADRMHSQH